MIFTNGCNFVCNSSGRYRRTNSIWNFIGIHRWNNVVGIHRHNSRQNLFNFEKKTVWWCGSFWGRFYRLNYRGIQTGISVQWRDLFTNRSADRITDRIVPSVKVNISLMLPTLSSLISPFSFSSLHLNKLSPPKLQITTPQNIHHFSIHKSSFFFFVVTIFVFWFIVDFVIFYK